MRLYLSSGGTLKKPSQENGTNSAIWRNPSQELLRLSIKAVATSRNKIPPVTLNCSLAPIHSTLFNSSLYNCETSFFPGRRDSIPICSCICPSQSRAHQHTERLLNQNKQQSNSSTITRTNANVPSAGLAGNLFFSSASYASLTIITTHTLQRCSTRRV